jgi:hypothetical protein
VAVYLDATSEVPYRLHFFEMTIKGQNSKGDPQALHGELVAVREELGGAAERFSVVPADCLLDFPAHPTPSAALDPIDAAEASDFLKSTHQMEVRERCQQERRHFVGVCREYLERSFDARIRAAQDRVMGLRSREAAAPEISFARQRAENDLSDLKRTRDERLAGLERLALARHGPVRHVASALVLPVGASAEAGLAAFADDLDPEVRRRSELAAEDVVIAFETARGWECERVGHLKIGFDVRSLGSPHNERVVQGRPTRRFLLALRRLGPAQ